MLDITLKNIELELIEASRRQPVLLDIWAPWCGPCKALGPVLERLERDYAGRFVLAKLNSDEQPEIAGQLSQMFGVRSIPFCVLFKDGQPVDGFVGAVPDAEVRRFLDKHVQSLDEIAADGDLRDAEAALAEGDVEGALAKLREAVTVDPTNDAARFDYLHALLSAGHTAQAREVFDPLAARGVLLDPRLAACGHWLAACERATQARPHEVLRERIAHDRRDFDARFELAQTLFAAQHFTAAMDELLEIVMRDKSWRDEIARKTYVAILELMRKAAPSQPGAKSPSEGTLVVAAGKPAALSDPLVDAYHRKLSMAIF